jgi:hypothetical protein
LCITLLALIVKFTSYIIFISNSIIHYTVAHKKFSFLVIGVFIGLLDVLDLEHVPLLGDEMDPSVLNLDGGLT